MADNKKPNEDPVNDVINELGGAVARLIDLLGRGIDKGTIAYNECRNTEKYKELSSKVSSEANKLSAKVKSLFNKN